MVRPRSGRVTFGVVSPQSLSDDKGHQQGELAGQAITLSAANPPQLQGSRSLHTIFDRSLTLVK